MATYWISYDGRDESRGGGRKWLWLLLPLLLVGVLVGSLLWPGDSDPAIDLSEPAELQAALPILLTDDVMVVYAVDNSGSMAGKLLPLHQALHEVANKPTENSEIALVMFGDSSQVLFDFTEPAAAPWDDAIPSFAAQSGGTALFHALQEAQSLLPDRPVCSEKSRLLLFRETVCRENRIVLMSDGMAGDFELAEAALNALVRRDVAVDTVAFGDDADQRELRLIADVTGGSFIQAH